MPQKHLLKGRGTGTPPGENQAQANGLEDTGKSANSDGVEGTLLSDDLGDDLRNHVRKTILDWTGRNVPRGQRKP